MNDVSPRTLLFATFAFLVGFGLLAGGAGCASSGGTSPNDGGDGDQTGIHRTPDEDISTEKLEKLVDQKMRRDLRPTENSPGPIMITMFSRHRVSSQLKYRDGQPNKKTRKQLGKKVGINDPFLYLILVSKEWAHEDRPVREPFLDYARPRIKILSDNAMNTYLDFLEKHQFAKFPEVRKVSDKDIKSLQRGDKYLTLWRGNSYRRVLFNERLNEEIMAIAEKNQERGQKLMDHKSKLLLGFPRMFNFAPFGRIRVRKSNRRMNNFLQQLAGQANRETRRRLEELLLKAREQYRDNQYRAARQTLRIVMKEGKDTVYYPQAVALLKKVSSASSTSSNGSSPSSDD